MPLTVTFDTGTLSDVLRPDKPQPPTNPTDAARVRDAIEVGDIQGFFSETLITLEGIQKKDRARVLGSSRLVSSSSSESRNKITITLAFQQDREPLPPEFSNRIQVARDFGMRALMVPRSLGVGVCAKDDDGTLFKPIANLEQFVARATHLESQIGARSVGRAAAVLLRLEFSARDGMSGQELWLQGLGRAKTDKEMEKVARAAAEWADGASVAAHYGYGVDLFCTRDFGKNASGHSILNLTNRKWLTDAYGIHFVTLAELADMTA